MQDITENNELDSLLTEMAQPAQHRDPATEPIPETIIEQKTKEETAQPLDDELIQATADFCIGTFDIGQTNIFHAIWKRKKTRLLDAATDGKGQVTLLQAQAKAQKNNGTTEGLTDVEIQALTIGTNVDSYIQDLPLKDKERQNLAIPLAVILRRNGGIIPPEIALMLGITTIVGGRISELYLID